MRLKNGLEIHLVQLVTRENERVLEVVVLEMLKILSNRIGCPLIPTRARETLFSRQEFDESSAEVIKLVALGDVPVQ